MGKASVPSLFEKDVRVRPLVEEPDGSVISQSVLSEAQVRGRPDREAFRRDLDRQKIFDQLVVATHPLIRMQKSIAGWLESDPTIQGIPVLALVNQSFAAEEEDFVRKVNWFMFSHGGNLNPPLVAREIFILGGFEEFCLSRTLEDLAIHAQAAGLDRIKIHLVSDLTYTHNAFGIGSLLRDPTTESIELIVRLRKMFVRHEVLDGEIERDPDTRVCRELILVDRHRHTRETDAISSPPVATIVLIIKLASLPGPQ